ncbi:hypothetical protein SRABI128_02086 [Microbacterium sp. Bi128]|nr:hypothetical protein SRABI128_02086 [Microbacterium sp. Bi128]
MRAMRFSLPSAETSTTTSESTAGTMNMRSLMPAKNRAPSTTSTRIITVPRSLPPSTVPITSTATGTTGMNTCFHDVSSRRLR